MKAFAISLLLLSTVALAQSPAQTQFSPTQVAGWLVGRQDIAGRAGEGRLSIDLRGLGAHEHDS
jgi:hypothetical protein